MAIELRSGASTTSVSIGETSKDGCVRAPTATLRSGSADALIACAGLMRHRFPLTRWDAASDKDLVLTLPLSVRLEFLSEDPLFDHATVVTHPLDPSESCVVTLQRSAIVAAPQGASMDFLTFSADGRQLGCGRHAIEIGEDRRYYPVKTNAYGVLVASCSVTTEDGPFRNCAVTWGVFGASLMSRSRPNELLVTETNDDGRVTLRLPSACALIRVKASHPGCESAEGSFVATIGAENHYSLVLRKAAMLTVDCTGLPIGDGLSIVNSAPPLVLQASRYYAEQRLDAAVASFRNVPIGMETDIKVIDADWNVLAECRVPPIPEGATAAVALGPVRTLARLTVVTPQPEAIRRVTIGGGDLQSSVSFGSPISWPVIRYFPVGTVTVTAEDALAGALSTTELTLGTEGNRLEIMPGVTRRLHLHDQDGEAMGHYPITVSAGRVTRKLYSNAVGDLILAPGAAFKITDGINGNELRPRGTEVDTSVEIELLDTVIRTRTPGHMAVQVIALGAGQRLTKEVWTQDLHVDGGGATVRLPYGRFQIRSTDGSVLFHSGFAQSSGQLVEFAGNGVVRVCLRGNVKRSDTAELLRRGDGARFLFPIAHDGAFIVPDPMVEGEYSVAIRRAGKVVSETFTAFAGRECIVDLP